MMQYTVKPTDRFRIDYKLMGKRNMDISLIDDVNTKLAQGIPLPAPHQDHALTGNYAGSRECHIQPDWLLIYRIDDDILVLVLTLRKGFARRGNPGGK